MVDKWHGPLEDCIISRVWELMGVRSRVCGSQVLEKKKQTNKQKQINMW